MRQFLWALLMALFTLLPSADASSTTITDSKQVLQVNSSKEVSTMRTGIENNRHKRLLRDEVKKADPPNEENDEARAISIRFQGSIQRLVEKLRKWNPFSTENIKNRFVILSKEGKTPDDYYMEAVHGGTWEVVLWKWDFYKKYEAWYTQKHPNWRSSFPK